MTEESEVLHSVEVKRRIFRLQELQEFSELNKDDLFILLEDNAEIENTVFKFNYFVDENEIDADIYKGESTND